MNKHLERRIYHEADDRLADEPNPWPKRKVLHSRILKLSGDSLYKSIGMALLESGQFQKSLIPLKRVTITRPKDADAQVKLAQAFFKLKRDKEAFSCLQKALCIYPISSQIQETVIWELQKRGRLDDLSSFYHDIANILADKKSISSLYFTCAEILAHKHHFSPAFEMYQKAIEADPIQSHYHYQYAMGLYHESLFEEAIVQFEHAKRLCPENNLAFNNIAHIKYCLGRLEEAYEDFEYIIANGLVSAGTYSNFILVLYHLDKDEEVIEKYKELLLSDLANTDFILRGMYQEALRITVAILEKDDIDEKMREFNTKKIKALNLVLSFLN